MPMKEVEVEEQLSGLSAVRGYRRNWTANEWMDPSIKARLINKVYAAVPKEAHQTIILGKVSMETGTSVVFRMTASFLAGVLRDCADCGRKVEVQAHVLGSDDDRWCGLCRARREAQRKMEPCRAPEPCAEHPRIFQAPVASRPPSEAEALATTPKTLHAILTAMLPHSALPPPRRFPEVEERMAVKDRKLISFGHAEDARSVGLGCLVGPKVSDLAAFFAAPELLTAIDGWVASGRALKLPEYLKRCRLLEWRAWWQR